MKIKINGEIRECDDNTTLLEIIQELGLTDKVMAAAVNMNIIKQDHWNDKTLVDDDCIELLDFVGGG